MNWLFLQSALIKAELLVTSGVIFIPVEQLSLTLIWSILRHGNFGLCFPHSLPCTLSITSPFSESCWTQCNASHLVEFEGTWSLYKLLCPKFSISDYFKHNKRIQVSEQDILHGRPWIYCVLIWRCLAFLFKLFLFFFWESTGDTSVALVSIISLAYK